MKNTKKTKEKEFRISFTLNEIFTLIASLPIGEGSADAIKSWNKLYKIIRNETDTVVLSQNETYIALRKELISYWCYRN